MSYEEVQQEDKRKILIYLDYLIDRNFLEENFLEENKFNRKQGFCSNWMRFDARIFYPSLLSEFINKYSLYTGNSTHPIPHPTLDPSKAYWDSSIDKWDYSTEYGRNRRMFIKEFKEFILREWSK
jgi:hypothetical protein